MHDENLRKGAIWPVEPQLLSRKWNDSRNLPRAIFGFIGRNCASLWWETDLRRFRNRIFFQAISSNPDRRTMSWFAEIYKLKLWNAYQKMKKWKSLGDFKFLLKPISTFLRLKWVCDVQEGYSAYGNWKWNIKPKNFVKIYFVDFMYLFCINFNKLIF